MYFLIGLILFFLHFLFLFGFFVGRSRSVLLSFESLNVGFLDFSFFLIFDILSMGFVTFVLFISSVVFVYSSYYMGKRAYELRFVIILLLFILSINVLVLRPGFLGVLLGWDGLGITSFLLVIYYMNVSSLRSGLVTVYTNRLGDMFLLLGMYFIAKNFFLRLEVFWGDRFFVLVFLILLGGITKRAQLPFSSWLPAAIAAPTPVSSLVHSSTLVTAGVYLFIRYYFVMRCFIVRKIFCWFSVITSFMAGLMAYFEKDLKKLVAISTLSQLGIIMFICSLGEFSMCFFHIVSHALFKSLLFLSCGGLIILMGGDQDMRFMGGFSFLLKISLLLVTISRLNLVGFPFMSGFFSKDIILELGSFFEYNLFIFLLFIFSCMFSLVYRIKLLYWSFNVVVHWNGNFQFVYNDFLLWSLKGGLLIWSIIIGKFFVGFFFDGELNLINFFDKIQGVFIFLLGGFLFYFMVFINIKKYLEVYYIEIGYLNWFFGDFFSKGGFSLVYLGEWDKNWIEMVGPSGFKNLLIFLSFKISFYKKSLKSSLILLLILILFIIGLFFSLYLKRSFEETEKFNNI